MAKAKSKTTKSKKGKKSKKNVVKVNFKGVEGKRVLLPEADYHVRVKEVTQEEGDAADYLKWEFSTISDDKRLDGQSLYTNTSLSPKSLWNLRGMMEALGTDVPDSSLEIDLDELVDLELIVTVSHEIYNDKKQAKVVDFAPVDGYEDEDEEDAEIDDDEEDEDVEEEEDEDDVDDEDEDEEDEEEDDEDDEDEEEDEGLTKEAVNEMSTKELKALIKEHKLGKKVDLDEHKSTRKKRKAVIEALEAKGLLEE